MKFSNIRTVIVVISLAVMLVGLAACNTVQGVGKDIEATGKAVQDASD